MNSRLPVIAAKRFPPICCNIVFDIISAVLRVLSVGGAYTANPFKILVSRQWVSAVATILSHRENGKRTKNSMVWPEDGRLGAEV